jgi:hypothetical protein
VGSGKPERLDPVAKPDVAALGCRNEKRFAVVLQNNVFAGLVVGHGSRDPNAMVVIRARSVLHKPSNWGERLRKKIRRGWLQDGYVAHARYRKSRGSNLPVIVLCPHRRCVDANHRIDECGGLQCILRRKCCVHNAVLHCNS